MKICVIDGCDQPVRARGWCNAHYSRWYRYGDPTHVKAPKVPYLNRPDQLGRTFAADDKRHGTVNGYSNLKCRCPDCREAWRIKHNEYMHADPTRLRKHAERERRRREREARS